jgi:hypothetical protein
MLSAGGAGYGATRVTTARIDLTYRISGVERDRIIERKHTLASARTSATAHSTITGLAKCT